MRTILISLAVSALAAETHTLTRGQTVDTALKQNPDLVIARLDEQKAREQVRVARDPFLPKVFAGSGAAYTSGFPMSVEGSAPTILQARAVASVFNKPQSYQLAQARENARGAALSAEAQRDRIAFAALDLWLRGYWTSRTLDLARQQASSLEKAAGVVRARVEAGRETPIEARRADLEVARARHAAVELETALDGAEGALAMVLGFAPGDRVRAAAGEAVAMETPGEDAAVAGALAESREIRRLESAVAAKELEAASHRAARWPRLSLVAQYGLFARFNNYDDFFQRFQRHNGQIGVALEVPIVAGEASRAMASQASTDLLRLRAEIAALKHRISTDTRDALQEIRRAASARDFARLDLDVAREGLSVALARYEEGRATLAEVEQGRAAEQSKWIAYFGSQHALERARYALLRQTGGLIAAVR